MSHRVCLILRGGGDQDVGEHAQHAAVTALSRVRVLRTDAKSEQDVRFVPAGVQRPVVHGERAADLHRHEARRG